MTLLPQQVFLVGGDTCKLLPVLACSRGAAHLPQVTACGKGDTSFLM